MNKIWRTFLFNQENKLLTFYPYSIRKKNPNKAGIGPDTSAPCSTRIGLFLDLNQMIKGYHSCSLNVSSPLQVHFASYVLNKSIQCFFKFLRPSSCNWPNWHLQWVVGMITLGVGLIRINEILKISCHILLGKESQPNRKSTSQKKVNNKIHIASVDLCFDAFPNSD